MKLTRAQIKARKDRREAGMARSIEKRRVMKVARMVDHEKIRFARMTDGQMKIRIRKMTNLEKIALTISEAKRRGLDTIQKMAIAQRNWVRQNVA